MTNKSQQHMNDTLRKEISEILVKWSMPTRQVAINEIVTLFTQHQERVIEKLEKRKEFPVYRVFEAPNDIWRDALTVAISIIREEMK